MKLTCIPLSADAVRLRYTTGANNNGNGVWANLSFNLNTNKQEAAVSFDLLNQYGEVAATKAVNIFYASALAMLGVEHDDLLHRPQPAAQWCERFNKVRTDSQAQLTPEELAAVRLMLSQVGQNTEATQALYRAYPALKPPTEREVIAQLVDALYSIVGSEDFLAGGRTPEWVALYDGAQEAMKLAMLYPPEEQ